MWSSKKNSSSPTTRRNKFSGESEHKFLFIGILEHWDKVFPFWWHLFIIGTMSRAQKETRVRKWRMRGSSSGALMLRGGCSMPGLMKWLFFFFFFAINFLLFFLFVPSTLSLSLAEYTHTWYSRKKWIDSPEHCIDSGTLGSTFWSCTTSTFCFSCSSFLDCTTVSQAQIGTTLTPCSWPPQAQQTPA